MHPSNKPGEHIETLFTYHPPTQQQRDSYVAIREAAQGLAATILALCPPCADTTAAVRKVREAVMTANAAIALQPLTDTEEP